MELLKSLQIDAWYKLFVYLGSLLLIFGIFFSAYGITNRQVILFSSGILLIGIGEWKNHKKYFGIKPPNAYTGPAAWITVKIREWDVSSLLFMFIGVVLLILAVLDLLKLF